MKRVILTLEYDLGAFDDDGYEPSTNPEDYREYFEQADFRPDEFDIINVRIED